ncbi:MAG: hypothetical protein ACW99A_01085 [Candidatus Kariarchaeaceae archaeon]|jgi:hypothetical protein
MSEEKQHHQLAILCKSCKSQWSISIPITKNHVEVFAAVCDCGALIVGNYNYELHQSIKSSLDVSEYLQKKIYLTNGHYEILELTHEEIQTLPSLALE